MAKHTYRLQEEGVSSGYAAFEGLEAGAEFDHDFGMDAERAVIAAGWVARVDSDEPDKKRGK